MTTDTVISIPSNLTSTTSATRHSSAEEEKTRLLVEGEESMEESVEPGCHRVDSEINQEQEEQDEQGSLVQEDGNRESERRRLRQERGIVEAGDDALTASDWIPAVGVSIIFLAIVAFIFSQVRSK